MNRVILILVLLGMSLNAQFAKAPQGWGDFKIGLVSDGDEKSTNRLKKATSELGIKIDYRYRYINEGTNPSSNACQWVFPKPGNGTNYSEKSMELSGTEASYVIYVLQEEGGTTKLLNNIADPIKMRQFFHTLRIVAENANGHGATIIVEPDTWGYLMQDRFGTTENPSIEVDPTKIPAVVNNIPDSTYWDTTITPNWQTGIHDTLIREIHLDHSYLSDLPNNLAGIGRAIIRTMHKYAPDCYVGFLASHWSVNLNMEGEGWSSDGLVWATPALRDTSAKLNIEFFKKLYWGSIDDEHPAQPDDQPDFIGVEKNGWCAGRWKSTKGFEYWYWGDEQMDNYLKWCKQIAVGLDLPIVGWQISIGNMDNPNTFDEANMANAYQDTYFPYFFTHVQDFIDAGFIGFLVGKGLSQGTDYTLPEENIGEKGWFFNQLLSFDQGRPYLDTTLADVSAVEGSAKIVNKHSFSDGILRIASSKGIEVVSLYSLQGREVMSIETDAKKEVQIPLQSLASGMYVTQYQIGRKKSSFTFVKP